MKTIHKALTCAVLLGALAGAAPAAYAETTTTTVTRTERTFSTDSDRPVITEYVQTHRTLCPAGTIPTRGECFVPGNKVVVYQRGEIIPETVHYEMLPTAITTRLTPLPEGETYVAADGSVYVMDAKTRAVLDALTVPAQ